MSILSYVYIYIYIYIYMLIIFDYGLYKITIIMHNARNDIICVILFPKDFTRI